MARPSRWSGLWRELREALKPDPHYAREPLFLGAWRPPSACAPAPMEARLYPRCAAMGLDTARARASCRALRGMNALG